jgi:hypothetical protein
MTGTAGSACFLVVLHPWTRHKAMIAAQCNPITTAASVNIFFIVPPIKVFENKTAG